MQFIDKQNKNLILGGRKKKQFIFRSQMKSNIKIPKTIAKNKRNKNVNAFNIIRNLFI